MKGGDTARQISHLDLFKTRGANQIGEGVLVGEPANTLGQVLVGFAVPGHDLAEGR